MVGTFIFTSGNLQSFFKVVLGIVISTTTFSYILVFPAIVTLRRKYASASGRGYRIPGGAPVLWACVILCEFFIIAATIFSLWPGLCTANGCFSGDAIAAQGNMSRLTYEVVVLGTMAVIVGIGVWFWAAGRSRQTSDMATLEDSVTTPAV
jgi:hypothetical protein